MPHESLVTDFAIIFGVAALTIVLTSKLKLPSILGYLIAGVIVGPYIPIPLFANSQRIKEISELGVILVMFSIGLEFRIKKLLQIIPSAGLSALIQISALFLMGTYLGNLFGWSTNASFLLGASLSISSTMIVDKVFESNSIPNGPKELTYGILVIQDLFAIIIITVITSFSIGQELELKELVTTFSKIVLFIATLFVTGIIIIPRFIHFSLRFESREVTTIISCGICFSFAILAESIGYSVALGALIAGILVAESGRNKAIETNISQLRAIFSAMFFISVGMTINPDLSFQYFDKALIISCAIILTQALSIFFAGILSGHGIQTSLFAGLSLGQIGEFSFIIATIGRSFNIIDDVFYSIVVTAAVITSISTPLILRHANTIQLTLEKILPNRLQALILVYLSWYNHSLDNTSPAQIPIRKNLRRVILNVFLMIIISTLMSVLAPIFTQLITNITFLPWNSSQIYLFIELIVLLPFIVYALFSAYGLTFVLSQNIWKTKKTTNPIYRVIILAIRLSIFFIVMAVVLLIVSPFITKTIYSLLLLIGTALTIILVIWKKSDRIQDQMEQSLNKFITTLRPKGDSSFPSTLEVPKNIIPGLQDLKIIKISSENTVCGKKLSTLNLKSQTGATIFAIIQNETSISLPGGDQVISDGALIAIVGGEVSIAKATEILTATT